MTRLFSILKTAAIATAVAASGVALLALSLFALVQYGPVQERLVTFIEDWFFRKTGGRLEIGAFSGSIPASMSFEAITVTPPDSGMAVLEAATLEIGLDPASVINGPVQVRFIRLDSARLDLREPGRLTFLEKLRPETRPETQEESSGIGWTLDEIRISRTRARAGVEVGGRRVSDVLDISFDAAAAGRDGRITLDVASASFRIPDLYGEPVRFTGRAGIRDGQLTLDDAVLKPGLSEIRFMAAFNPGRTRDEQSVSVQVTAMNLGADLWTEFLPEKMKAAPGSTIKGAFVLYADRELVRLREAEFQTEFGTVRFHAEMAAWADTARRSLHAELVSAEVPLGWVYRSFGSPQGFKKQKLFTSTGSFDWTPGRLDARLAARIDGQHVDVNVRLDPARPEAPVFLRTSVKRLNLVRFLENPPFATSLNGWMEAEIGAAGTSGRRTIDLRSGFLASTAGEIPVTSASLSAAFADSVLRGNLSVATDRGSLTTGFVLSNADSLYSLDVNGLFEAIDLSRLTPGDIFHKTLLNGSFAAAARGRSASDAFGRLSVDMDTSFVDNRVIPYHQFFFDINEPVNPVRRIRLASSLVDLEITGRFDPAAVPATFGAWAREIRYRVNREVLFRPDTLPAPTYVQPLQAELMVRVKDARLASGYLQAFKGFQSEGRLDAELVLDNESASFMGRFSDTRLALDGVETWKPSVGFSAQLFRGREWKDRSNMTFEASWDSLQARKLSGGAMQLSLNQFNESARLQTRFDRIQKTGVFEAELDLLLAVENLDFTFKALSASYQGYGWALRPGSAVQFRDTHAWSFRDFALENGTERVSLEGTFSDSPSDSVAAVLEGVDLKRIADLLRREYTFAGTVSGLVTTRTLRTTPDIRGRLFAEGIRLNNRVVGDLTLASTYEPETRRFNTRLHLLTDPVKYADYLTENKGIGQNIVVEGFFLHPAAVKSDDDLLYSFQTDVRSFDGWVINPFIARLFQKLEGYAVGTASVAGSRKDVQFHGEFEIRNSHVVPMFLNTNYFATGPITIDRSEGLRFDNIRLRDSYSGSGTISGYLEWNNFQPDKPLFVEGYMENLQILNNYFVTDVPFFGTVSGTGGIRLSGHTGAPVLQTVGRCIVTPGAQLTLPLLDVENFEEKTNFIEFVSRADSSIAQDAETPAPVPAGTPAVTPPAVPAAPVVAPSKTFTELFTLNLQFDIPAPSNVKLLFDPVINEAINAEGGGAMVITLEKEVYRMFGRLDILRGDYLFNGGDLITRRFILQPGGAIAWDGDPKNGSLDARAVYRARPDLSPVLPNAPVNPDNTRQRIYAPVNLIVHMTGPLYQLQNDFSFELESNIATSQDANIITALNNLNNPQTKLIQASSLMLTGSFLEDSQTQQQRLGNDFDNKVTQNYFAQLLSNQINQMLSRNMSNVDVSINMQGFNQMSQTEVGVAVRLLDDRLVLRREGQIGGQNATAIGDIGATYRLNEYLSVEAFHKQDPTRNLFQQNAASGTQQTINGVGVEAQVQFESWKDLKKKTGAAFKKMFKATPRKKEENEPVAQGNNRP